MAKKKTLKSLAELPASKRPKQEEIPLKGKGVEIVTDKKLIALGDEFVEIRDQKATLATKLKEAETKILARMDELKLKVFRFADQIVTQKDGARHVKIKTVKAADEYNEPETAGAGLGEEQ